ncbi:AAA family ATPase [Flavobacterium gelatinilyticum]|uniref:AAA family ATPase n=1 Tax=Flavobacterium gelatinilyticum TaxID=3003260 RepID=UPI0024811179|nr:AAA family ATPase [Flavobacterium gelatinilyticum]
MTHFRLYSARFEEKDFTTNEIRFVNTEHKGDANYISLIVGNNGTGKSRVLSKIARFFLEKSKTSNSKSSLDLVFEYNRIPQKIIALTNSGSDKFPIDESFRPSKYSLGTTYFKDFKYNYLGTRSKANSFSNKSLMNRALDILFESYSELDVSRNYRHIFDYLDYEPVIKLDYKVTSRIFNTAYAEITPDYLFTYVNELNDNFRFRTYGPGRTMEIIGDKMEEICDFLNSYRKGKGELVINFSAKNINRILIDNSKYIDNVQSYKLITILKQLDIIRNIQIKVYKKGGSEFNFNDASSGEANILSTLIALIPVVQDNSLVLIDEPEISLHPLWQSQYIDLINKIFSNFKGCHIIIASHSHFLVTDLPPQQSSVIMLRNKKGLIKSERIEEPTYGWSAEEILYTVFNVKTVRNHFIESDLIDLLGLISDKSDDLDKIKKLLKSIKSLSISENDPLHAVIEEATAYINEND